MTDNKSQGIVNHTDVPKRLRNAVQRTIETISSSRLCSVRALKNTYDVLFSVEDLAELVAALKAANEQAGVVKVPRNTLSTAICDCPRDIEFIYHTRYCAALNPAKPAKE